MRRIEDVYVTVPFNKCRTNKTGVSATIDTLGGHDVLLSIIRGSTSTTVTKFYFYHASASTVLAASATAYGTNPTLTLSGASTKHAILFEGQNDQKRYIRVKLSAIGASMNVCLVAHRFTNRAIPSEGELGDYTALVRPLV